MLFAAFTPEIDYPKWENLLPYFELWLRKAGFGAVIVLFIWLLWFVLKAALRDGQWVPHGLTGRLDTSGETNNWRVRLFWVMLGVTFAAIIGGIVAYFLYVTKTEHFLDPFELPNSNNPTHATRTFTDHLINIFCGLALLTLSLEFLFDVFRFSPRRLIAIARFSIKEAVRRKVLWSFLLLGLVVLFASWFITTEKKDDQWRQYVNLVFFVVSAMVLVMSAILACFSLPTDIKQQTIYTVVTKPVQKLEIVLGRIVGIVLLMTVILAIAGAVSLVYVARGVDPEVIRQASRARGVEFGPIRFFEVDPMNGQTVERKRFENIGREWDYFSYLRGASTQEAVWYYPEIGNKIAHQNKVPVECTFDIFRTSKGGGERFAQGVSAQFTFINRAKWRGDFTEFRNARHQASGLPLTPEEKAARFGYYELPQPVTVYDEGIPTIVTFPAALVADTPNATLEIHLSCRSPNQYLGTAAKNLFILVAEQNWVVNYFKGLAGVWFYMVLITTMGVVFSTYLNAPVSLLLTVMLILGGQPRVLGFINEQALPPDVERPGGSFFEAALRLAEKRNMVVPLAPTGMVKTAQLLDNYVSRYVFKGVSAILPELAIYDRTIYVAEGFDIPMGELGATAVHLLLYLFPFLLLGYYLLTGREIAN
jgi:hypothetical protein